MPRSFTLLHDGSLVLDADPTVEPLLRRWLPLLPDTGPDAAVPAAGAAVLRATAAPLPSPPAPDTAPDLRLGTVAAWIAGDRVALAGPLGVRGRLDLAALRGQVAVPPGADPEAAGWELYSACTISCALLLGRIGRALVHAAAVAAPGGGALLLAGDTHAGKTTTCVNLLQAGWHYLSDDNVVLYRGHSDTPWVEGWPRPFHLDEGWAEGRTGGRRADTDPRARWPGRWRRTAPLGGVLLPRVEPGRPTALEAAAPAGALSELLRQSPWLLADRVAAPDVLSLLREAASAPARRLRLGLDTYADPDLLAERIQADAAST